MAAARQTKRTKGRGSATLPLVLLALVVWVAAAYFAVTGDRGLKLWRSIPGVATGSPAPSSSATAPPSASTPPAPTSTATASASASASAEVDPSACVQELFAADTFGKEPADFRFVCEMGDLRASGGQIKRRIMAARRQGVTQGMREWAGLGWYEMAAVSLFRARCCPAAPPIRFKLSPVCPIVEALTELEKAFASSDRSAADLAINGYGGQARCLYQSGQATNFGQDEPPGSGKNALYRFVERVRWGGSK